MERLRRVDRSPWAFRLVLAGIFLVMLGLNWMTPLLDDDYTYVHSWADWSVLTSPLQIPASMYAHGLKMNGRMISHGFEQLFLIMPKHVFDVCNSLVLIWLLIQCHRICKPGKGQSLLLLLVSAMGFWCFTPAFGHVCLWQDGAVNYLWALAFCLWFLRPYLRAYLAPAGTDGLPWWRRGLFLVFSLLFGMYAEVTSFAGILVALGLLLVRWLDRRAGGTWLWFSLILAVAGFCVMLRMPSEMDAKAGQMELLALLGRFSAICQLASDRFLIPMLAWAVLMVLACLRGTDRKRRVVSLGFALGAAASCAELSAAVYVPMRCLCTASLFLVLADGILLGDLLRGGEKAVCLCLSAALCLTFCLSFTVGVYDNLDAHRQWLDQKAAIDHAVETGQRAVVVEKLRPKTEYAAAYGNRLGGEDPKDWPNRDMAEYYGLDSILAK